MTTMKKIYCKLPAGIAFDVYKDNGEIAGVCRLNGGNQQASSGSVLPGHGVTEVEEEVWERVQGQYGTMAVFQEGHIFTADRVVDAKAIASERATDKTGFEQLDPKKIAKDVTPSDDKSVNKGIK